MQVHYIHHIHKEMGPHVIIFQFRCVQSHYHTHIKSTWPCSRPLQAFCERMAHSKELREFDHGTVTVSSKNVFPSSICDQQSVVLLETRRLYSRHHSKAADNLKSSSLVRLCWFKSPLMLTSAQKTCAGSFMALVSIYEHLLQVWYSIVYNQLI